MTDKIKYVFDSDGQPRATVLKELDTDVFAEVVYIGGQSKEANYREIIEQLYRAKSNISGASSGDLIRKVEVIDVSTSTPSTVSVGWTNLETASDIPAPVLSTVTLVTQGDGLTQAQLIASGLGTSSNQIAEISYLADIAQGIGRYSSYATQQVDEATAGTTYIRKAGADSTDTWLIQKVIESGTDTTIYFAGIRNNPSVSTGAAAWTNRATLVYGDIGSA